MKSITLIYSEGLFVSHHVSFKFHVRCRGEPCEIFFSRVCVDFFLTIKELFAVVVVADEMGVREFFSRLLFSMSGFWFFIILCVSLIQLA
jgi:hypothetical protein